MKNDPKSLVSVLEGHTCLGKGPGTVQSSTESVWLEWNEAESGRGGQRGKGTRSGGARGPLEGLGVHWEVLGRCSEEIEQTMEQYEKSTLTHSLSHWPRKPLP